MTQHIDGASESPHNPNASLPPIEIAALTIPQTAKVLAVSERTVWSLIADGTLEAVHIAGARRVLIEDLRGFLERLKAERAKRAAA